MVLQFNSRTDRLMARVAITIFSLGAIFGLYMFGRPVYWRFYATVLRPFESTDPTDVELEGEDPFSEAILMQGQAKTQGTGTSDSAIGTTAHTPADVQLAVKQPFDVNNYPLTKERVQGLLQDGYIMVTWANYHYLDFARSWVHHVKKAGITGYLVGAMDDEMLEALAGMGVNTWRMNSGITKNDLGWGSPNFHKMGRVKISLIKQFLDLGVTVVISDIDTAWLLNPLPFFSRYPAADILTSTDQLVETVKDDRLERYPEAGASFNIGIMMFRPNSSAFVEQWIKELEKPDMWDQTAFNDLARRGSGRSGEDGLFKGNNGRLTLGILPASIFASGHMFFVQRKYEELGLQPYVAHATFQYSGTPGKRTRFREFLLWDDPPEYFDHPKGFVHMRLDIPRDLLEKASGQGIKGQLTANKLDNHFNLVHYQLLRLRTVLALATITGRVVILPPIWCEIDKYWSALENGGSDFLTVYPQLDTGNIPGTRFRKPFICPADHVFDIEAHWARELPADAFGPHIEWREYSFLQNPRLTAAVNNSRLIVQPCDGDCPGGVTATDVQDGKISVSSAVDMARLRQVLNSPQAATFKILELPAPAMETLHHVWKTFPQPELDRFTLRLKHYPGCTCCLQEHPPGWVWYDFLMDVAHNDRFGRPFNGTFIYYKGDKDDLATLYPVGSQRKLQEQVQL